MESEDEDELAVLAAVMSAANAAVAVAECDWRSLGLPRERRGVIGSDVLERALAAPDERWFRASVRCSLSSFLHVVGRVEDAWTHVHVALSWSNVSVSKRVAATLYYLGHASSIEIAGLYFGLPKSSAYAYIRETMLVLQWLSTSVIRFPITEEYMRHTAAALEALAGIPGVVGAVDGSLIRRLRPNDYHGWYSRKGYPAINVQATVDAERRFTSYSIRAGAMNDQSVWNGSLLSESVMASIPSQYHLVADSGYALMRYLLTSYPVEEALVSRQMRRFNLAHARTRNPVECAFGILKNRWRILQCSLRNPGDDVIARTVVVCMTLHNMLIDTNDSTPINLVDCDFGLHRRLFGRSDDEDKALGGIKRDNISWML